MSELELTRCSPGRRLYSLEGVGTVRLEGLLGRTATAVADNETWRLSRRGFWQRGMEARDGADTVAGEYEPRGARRGGVIRWHGRELKLEPTSAFRERYSLTEPDEDPIILDGHGWGKRPVRIVVPQLDSTDPGLLLFATFVVHQLAGDTATAAAASANVAATG